MRTNFQFWVHAHSLLILGACALYAQSDAHSNVYSNAHRLPILGHAPQVRTQMRTQMRAQMRTDFRFWEDAHLMRSNFRFWVHAHDMRTGFERKRERGNQFEDETIWSNLALHSKDAAMTLSFSYRALVHREKVNQH
jgi:hypothetical protein